MPRRPSRSELEAEITSLRNELRHTRRERDRLRTENEILHHAAAPLIHYAPTHERFTFIHTLRDRFSLKQLCRILLTDRAHYRAWAKSATIRAAREAEEQQLLQMIIEIHTAYPTYGAERITRELKRQGLEAGRRRVARLMRENHIAGITRRKRRNLTRPGKEATTVPDLIRRDFTAPMPGLKLVGDITCLPTGEGWVYLATVLDLCTRELIGHAIAPHMRTGLAIDAITTAHRSGLVAGNSIMHTDRGGQYHSRDYHNTLNRLEIRPSTSRAGSCLDGAAAESFFATPKTEIGARFWPDRTSARRDIEDWITNYNQRRLHSTFNYQTPTAARLAWQ